jgi:hypothetical protein
MLLAIGIFTIITSLFFICIGFTLTGIRKASYASSIQSRQGNVNNNSIFSLLTSLAMKGFFCIILVFGIFIGFLSIYIEKDDMIKFILETGVGVLNEFTK